MPRILVGVGQVLLALRQLNWFVRGLNQSCQRVGSLLGFVPGLLNLCQDCYSVRS